MYIVNKKTITKKKPPPVPESNKIIHIQFYQKLLWPGPSFHINQNLHKIEKYNKYKIKLKNQNSLRSLLKWNIIKCGSTHKSYNSPNLYAKHQQLTHKLLTFEFN